VGLVLVVAVAVGGCDEEPSPEAGPREPTTAPSRSADETPPPAVAPRLKRAPRDCPGPDLERSRATRFYGPMVGESPLWGGFYARLDRRGSFHIPDARKTPVGYRIKVLWVMGAGRRDPVRVRGGLIGTEEPILFSVFGRGGEVAVLDPENPDAASERPAWREFPSYLFLPRAGCYELKMVGGWTIAFGFGR